MRTFKDNQKRTWEIEVNVHAVKRVRGALELDLLGVMEGGVLEDLINDPVLLCDMIYVLCKPQADEAGITDEDFGRAMAGDAIDAATTAVLEGLADFFPRPRREVLRKAIKKIGKLEAMAMNAAGKIMDGKMLEDKMKADLDEKLAEVNVNSEPPSVGSSSTSSPAQSESTPGH